MGSPTIFSGRYTKLLTNKGILNSDGSLNQNDGPINYVKYAEFEQNVTTGWSLGTTGTLTNAIPTGTPAFGSGASGNLSIATSNVSPIRDNVSLRYVSSAATTAGNMLATEALTIDAADQAKVLTFKFYYSVVSGASSGNFSGTSSNSFGVAIWDVTNSAWIGVAGNFSMTQNSGVGIASGTFQTNSNTSQIRLVIYNANATSGAITLAFDDFFVGPQTAPIGPVVTDWVSYTPTGGWTSNATYAGRYRRIGDSLEVQYAVTLTGAPNAAGLFINLPSGLTVDLAKMPTGSLADVAGSAQGLKSGTGYVFSSYLATATSVQVSYIVNGTTSAEGNVTNALPVAWNNGDLINGTFRVPIQGWSSSVQMSNDTDTRVVGFNGSIGVVAYTANTTNITATAVRDTHAAWNGSQYVAPVSGDYIAMFTTIANTTNGFGYMFVNGSPVSGYGSYQATANQAGSGTQYLPNIKAGDLISLRIGGSNGTTVTGGAISIFRISGPSVIAASESVSGRFYKTAVQSFSSQTKLVGYTTVFDSHAAWDSANSRYRIPVSGKYMIITQVQGSGGTSIGQLTGYSINGGGVFFVGTYVVGTNFDRYGGSDVFTANAGDYIELYHYTTGAVNVQPGELSTRFEIVRVGN